MVPIAAESPDRSGTSSPRIALKQRAYSELKQRILSDEFPAGAVLSVRQLATHLDMSKTPVHAAIERLEADGLVTLAPQQGVVIRELSVLDIVNHFQIRQALEPFVMRRLAGKLTTDQIEMLRQNLARHEEVANRGHVAAIVQTDATFHQLLCGYLGNDEITRTMCQLQDKVQRTIFRITRQFPQRVHTAYAEHRAIVDALVFGDGPRAAELANEHLERGLRRFLPHQ